jgi:single-strand DNA-binding protein
VNKVILLGNLGRDPEVKMTQGGQQVATFSIATSDSWTKDGQRQERTEWHTIVAWGKLAELAGKYLKKGRKVYVEGKLQTRSWDGKDGTKKYATEVIASSLTFVDSSRGDAPASAPAQEPAHSDGYSDFGPSDSDVPF